MFRCGMLVVGVIVGVGVVRSVVFMIGCCSGVLCGGIDRLVFLLILI